MTPADNTAAEPLVRHEQDARGEGAQPERDQQATPPREGDECRNRKGRHAVHEWGDRMDPTTSLFVRPGTTGQHETQAEIVTDARRGGLRLRHRPDDLSSPRRARRSRSSAASAGTRPGMLASVVAAAVCS